MSIKIENESKSLLKSTYSYLRRNKDIIVDYTFIMHNDNNPAFNPRFSLKFQKELSLKKEILIFYVEIKLSEIEKIFKKLEVKRLFMELDEYIYGKASDIVDITNNKFYLMEKHILKDQRIKRFISTCVDFEKAHYLEDNIIIAVIPYYGGFIFDIWHKFFTLIHVLSENQKYDFTIENEDYFN